MPASSSFARGNRRGDAVAARRPLLTLEENLKNLPDLNSRLIAALGGLDVVDTVRRINDDEVVDDDLWTCPASWKSARVESLAIKSQFQVIYVRPTHVRETKSKIS